MDSLSLPTFEDLGVNIAIERSEVIAAFGHSHVISASTSIFKVSLCWAFCNP